MDSLIESHELESVITEYALYFEACKLVKGDISHLKIVGERNFDIGVTLRGWYILGTKEYYETFETLMMNVYPNFQKKFNFELSSKLENLASNNAYDSE